MRVDAEPLPPGRRVAHRAIALGVAAHAGVEVALCLPCVMSLPAISKVGKTGRMKAMAVLAIRPAHGDTGSLMAGETEALLVVTTRAARVVLEGRDGMHREPVVRVEGALPDLAVVTVGAEVLRMTARAELRVVGGDEAVSDQEVGRVMSAPEPPRW